MQANPGKELELEIEGKKYLRVPVQTELIVATDDIVQVVNMHTEGLVQSGDLIVVSEKVVAITQGRAFRINEIKPSRLAVFLSRICSQVSPWDRSWYAPNDGISYSGGGGP